NPEIDAQNLDNGAARTTDAGVVKNLKWSFSLSHTRLLKGGWVREQVIQDLPPSVDLADAERYLEPNAYRELQSILTSFTLTSICHWHRVAEWGYILNSTSISAIDENGKSYIQRCTSTRTYERRGSQNFGVNIELVNIPQKDPYIIQW
ncbi:hypothetical protein BDN70DRAFT_807362, partial [Pholiota conissans]